MTTEDNLGEFAADSGRLIVVDPPPRRPWQGWLPLVLGGLVLLVAGVLIGLMLGQDENPNDLASAAGTTPTTTTSTTEVVPPPPTSTASGATSASTGATARRGAPTTIANRRATGAPTSASTSGPVTTTRTSERIVGRTSGGGGGNGTTTIAFSVTGAWRIDHKVERAPAEITVIDQAGGYSFSYSAPVGSGSRSFNRTCNCRVAVSSPDGIYTVTVVDTGD